jgi:hypothetical protein
MKYYKTLIILFSERSNPEDFILKSSGIIAGHHSESIGRGIGLWDGSKRPPGLVLTGLVPTGTKPPQLLLPYQDS